MDSSLKISRATKGWCVDDLTQEEKAAVANWVSLKMGMQLTAVKKARGDFNAGDAYYYHYYIYTPRGVIRAGTMGDFIISQTKLRTSIARDINYIVPRIKADDWHNIAQALLNLCETVGENDL
jgi:hypothetical protein